MKFERLIVFILLALFFASGVYYALTNSITSDEFTHIPVGYIYLHFNDYRFNIEHPPLVKQLAALPLYFLKINFPFAIYKSSTRNEDICKIQDAFLFNSGNDLDLILFLSRLPNILIALVLGFFIYLYSKMMNGPWAGVLSLGLFVLSPSFLGHSPLVTMDTAIACFYFTTVYFLMRFFQTRSNLYLLLTGVSLGIALISKFSAMVLIPVSYILIVIYAFFVKGEEVARVKRFVLLLPLLPLACSYKSSFKFIAPAIATFLIFIIFFRKNVISRRVIYASAILLIILTIAFTITILDYTDFKWFPHHGATKAYCKGFSSFTGHAEGGQGDAYLLGMHSSKGWWYYFPLAVLFKEPVEFFVIFLLGLVPFVLKKEGAVLKSLIIVPLLTYLFVSMFMNKVNIGVRHILPIYPFLYVIAGYSVILAKRFKSAAYAIVLLLLILSVDVAMAYPSHLSYFNLVIGGTDKGYKYLSDSNVAWGQDWKRLKIYVEKNGLKEIRLDAAFSPVYNCAYYNIPCRVLKDEEWVYPEKRVYVIDAMTLASGRIKWAYNVRPCSRIGGSLFVYRIDQKDGATYGT